MQIADVNLTSCHWLYSSGFSEGLPSPGLRPMRPLTPTILPYKNPPRAHAKACALGGFLYGKMVGVLVISFRSEIPIFGIS